MIHHRTDRTPRPIWHYLASRFPNDRECLASFLALETSELLAGEKPANLINVVNRSQGCGKNLYRLWRKYGSELLHASGLAASELVDRDESLLLFIYRLEALDALLARRNVSVLLRRAGYPEPFIPETVLAELQSRLLARGKFPHEIGVFLGYPLKDVMGFMGWAPLSFACQGPWKIYGDPAPSLKLANTFNRCRRRMAGRLARCATPFDCLAPSADPKEARGIFFRRIN
jgi:Protein of unknown function (DUF3793)